MKREIQSRELPPELGVKFNIDGVRVSLYNLQSISVPEPVAQEFLQLSYRVKSRQVIMNL